MLRSYHVVDPTTVALVLRSGIVLFLKSACCLWILFGGAAVLIELCRRRAPWHDRARRIAGDTRLTMRRTGWLLKRILAPMLAALLLLSGVAGGNDQVPGKPLSTVAPKSKRTALTRSLVWTLVPVAVGGALILHGQGNAQIGSDLGSGQTDDTETLAGLAIGSAGIIFGPGTGHACAGQMGRFWGGVIIRGVGASLTTALVTSASDNSSLDVAIMQGVIALVVGGSICLTSAIYDIATVGRSVDKYNHSHGFSDLRVRPQYFAATRAVGFNVSMSF